MADTFCGLPSSGRLIYIGINASLSEFGVGTYSGADWLKSTGLSVRKKTDKIVRRPQGNGLQSSQLLIHAENF